MVKKRDREIRLPGLTLYTTSSPESKRNKEIRKGDQTQRKKSPKRNQVLPSAGEKRGAQKWVHRKRNQGKRTHCGGGRRTEARPSRPQFPGKQGNPTRPFLSQFVASSEDVHGQEEQCRTG